MRFAGIMRPLLLATLAFSGTGLFQSAYAQIQITEILYDTAADETTWEWFEIRNAGKQAIDLDGFVFDDFSLTSNSLPAANITGAVSGGPSPTTVVPAGGVGIIYNGARLDYDEARFRAAWNLNASVALIGVDGFQALNNTGDTFGLWTSFENYGLDLQNTDDDEALEAASFNEAVAWIDYGAEGFPTATNASIEWDGTGNYQEGSNWIATTVETPGVTVSIETFLPIRPLNSALDIANPGVALGSGEANSLLITELMYNPASSEPVEWEWIEILNGSGQIIDFAQTPYVLDDLAGSSIAEPNVTVGRIERGEVAILFRDSIPLQNMIDAWGEGLTLIPVNHWSALNSGGDTIGIWSNIDDYTLDSAGEGDRTFDAAVTFVAFKDGGADGWPNIAEGQSISLLDLEGDPNDPTNWIISEPEDGFSRTPELVLSGELVDHAGGDLGTPGSFGELIVEPAFRLDVNRDGAVDAQDAVLLCSAAAEAGLDIKQALALGNFVVGDFDLNGEVEFLDFLVLADHFSQTEQDYGDGDADCDGTVMFVDFLIHADNFGKTQGAEAQPVPEPSSVLLMGFALLSLHFWRAKSIRG